MGPPLVMLGQVVLFYIVNHDSGQGNEASFVAARVVIGMEQPSQNSCPGVDAGDGIPARRRRRHWALSSFHQHWKCLWYNVGGVQHFAY